MPSRDLNDCVPELAQKIELIIKEYNELYPDRKLIIICSLRSTKEQQALYAKGRTIPPLGKRYHVTQVDGVRVFSAHNPDPIEPKAKAVDFGVIENGKYVVKDNAYFPLLALARKYNLICGLDFANSGKPLNELLKDGKFHDVAHVQVNRPLYKKV